MGLTNKYNKFCPILFSHLGLRCHIQSSVCPPPKKINILYIIYFSCKKSLPPPHFLQTLYLRLLYGSGGSEHEDPTALARLEIGESKPTFNGSCSRLEGVANGGVKSKKSLPKYVISGRVGSMFSLKYSMAMVDKSNSSSVTL